MNNRPSSNWLATKKPNLITQKRIENRKHKIFFSFYFYMDKKRFKFLKDFVWRIKQRRRKIPNFHSPLRNSGGVDGVRRRQRLHGRNGGRSTVVGGIVCGGVGTDLHERRSRSTRRPNLISGWDFRMNGEGEATTQRKKNILREND